MGMDLTSIPAYLGGGSLLYAVYLLIKARSESGAVVVKSAEGVVVLQSTMIKELREENEKLRDKIERQADKIRELQDKLEVIGRTLDEALETLKDHGIHLDKLDSGK